MDLYRRPFEFMKGYTDTKNRKYMNLGLGISPYPGKVGHGDYGPHQGGGLYYRPEAACHLATFHPDVSSNICSLPSNVRQVNVPQSRSGQCSSCD